MYAAQGKTKIHHPKRGKKQRRRETRTAVDSFFSRSHQIDEAQRLRATKTFDNPPNHKRGEKQTKKNVTFSKVQD